MKQWLHSTVMKPCIKGWQPPVRNGIMTDEKGLVLKMHAMYIYTCKGIEIDRICFLLYNVRTFCLL